MIKLLTDCFQDGQNAWDVSRIMWAVAVVTFLISAAYHFTTAQDFGIGAGAVLGGGGLGAMWHGKAP